MMKAESKKAGPSGSGLQKRRGDDIMRNPIIPQDAGDPYILKDGDDYYMTASGGGAIGQKGFVCWHSKNLQDWSEPITILDFKDVCWAEEKAWAPSMVEKDGFYYFAFCADQQIGIAVSQSPMGNFRDILGRPLVAKTDYDFQTIDPCFLKDDDGTVYLAFGQGKCMMSKIELSPGSAKFTGEMVCLSEMIYRQFSVNPAPGPSGRISSRSGSAIYSAGLSTTFWITAMPCAMPGPGTLWVPISCLWTTTTTTFSCREGTASPAAATPASQNIRAITISPTAATKRTAPASRAGRCAAKRLPSWMKTI